MQLSLVLQPKQPDVITNLIFPPNLFTMGSSVGPSAEQLDTSLE